MILPAPALFANERSSRLCLPTGLMMGKCEQSTVKAGVKAVLYGRLLTSAICVVVAYIVGTIAGF
ncbi:hypothetical protein [Ammoniphilus sp. 3BR4]|uniref:hypothetical protein n=1 Tax=Ammoniphilus sp. 3BR4 TaxID=3158265 RepID=UPI0034668AF5